ncbi:hypothetical protein VTN00DRAFT_8256 [Thermoascus crustaceus]|uniref:uncharacterized protein n=1 Tax=Thermoascus crustaceus TaxID=5088 RepID=UPI0037432E35
MDVALRPASRPDLPVLATIGVLAFRDTPLYAHFAPRHPQREGDFRAALLLEARTRFESPGQCVVVAEVDVDVDVDRGGSDGEDEDEREGGEKEGKRRMGRRMVVGFAYWVKVGGGSAGFGSGPGPSGTGEGKGVQEWYWKDTWGKKLRRTLLSFEAIYSGTLGPGRIFIAESVRRFHALTDQIIRNHASIIGREYWYLSTLAVLPAFQHRGIGARLVDWGLELARKEGVPVTLKSTESGYRLYERKGFKEVDAMQVTESLRVPIMVFEPS